MYHDDHAPPHFHVEYQGHEALISIASGEVIVGHLPRNAARIIKEWCLHQQEALLEDWHLAQSFLPLKRIPGADND